MAMASKANLVATVAAVRVGRVRAHHWNGREIYTGADKDEIAGPVQLGTLGLTGDEQADQKNHGGPDKALLLYADHHYPSWLADQGLELASGAFFENITLTGVDGRPCPDETTVVLGETWRLGQAIVQVSQPRSPCYKLAGRWGVPDLVQRVQRTGWSGWYVRVLEPGAVAKGDAAELLERPAGAPTVAEVTRIVNVDKHDLEGARRLLAASVLPERLRNRLLDRVAGAAEDDSARLLGPPV